MSATFSQNGDNPCRQQGLRGQYWPQMVTSRQVREALRKLRTDAKLEPYEFADEASVHRSTVYRIEKMEQDYAPRVDTVSALVDSRGLTLTAFFAALEGIAIEGAVTDPETEARVQKFRNLSPPAQAVALGIGGSIQEHMPSERPDESRRESPQAGSTTSGRGRRR